MNLHIDIEEQNDQTTLHLKGEIDVYTAPALKEALYPLAEKEKHVILLDLKHVEYLDSTGLGTIIGAMKIAKGQESTISIQHANERIRRLLDITGLSKVMEIKEREENEGS